MRYYQMNDEAKTEALVRRDRELLAQAETTREVARAAASMRPFLAVLGIAFGLVSIWAALTQFLA